MAEGFLKSFDQELVVYSAGTNPVQQIHPFAVKVMADAGIDISEQYTKNVNQFIHKSFDYVITVCDNAKDECPIFMGGGIMKLKQ
jgi:arsenate reductase